MDFKLEQKTLFEIPPQGEIIRAKGNIAFEIVYRHKNGELFQGNSIEWLKSLDSGTIDLIVADPPYNINKTDWDKFESQEEYIKWSLQWIKEASRVLSDTGTLYICGFSEILADLKHPSMQYFKTCRWLVWYYKNKANLGNDWGRSHESILHLRKSKNFTFNIDDARVPYGKHTLKYPDHPQAESSQYGNGNRKNHIWTPHPQGAKPRDVIEIPTTCNGMGEKTPHPTQKPEALIRRLVLVSSSEDDMVLDPFSGSGTTLVVAEQLNRKWLGCEIEPRYNEWAITRLENVARKTKEEWIEFDRVTETRRNSIR